MHSVLGKIGMAVLAWNLFLIVLATGCRASFLDESDMEHVTEMVRRLKRHSQDEIHGHSVGVLHAVDPATGQAHRLTKRDVTEHVKQGASTASRRFSLHLDNGDKVHLDLTRNSVVTAASTIVEILPGGHRWHHELPQDCFFTGTVAVEGGRAAFSLCDGEMMGSADTPRRSYEMYPLPHEVRRKRAPRSSDPVDPVHVLVTWANLNAAEDARSLHKRSTGLEMQDVDDGINMQDMDDEISMQDMDGGINMQDMDDGINMQDMNDGISMQDMDGGINMSDEPDEADTENADDGTEDERRRAKRVIIEDAVFVDSSYTNIVTPWNLASGTKFLIKMVLMKWSGMKAVLMDRKRLGWDITLRLVHLEIWNQNPEWYHFNVSTASIFSQLRSICIGSKPLKYDRVTVLTNARGMGNVGLAAINGVCSPRFRCSAVLPSGLKYGAEIHELGHNLGLVHENKSPDCMNYTGPDPPGFMNGRWPFVRECYKDTLDRTFIGKTLISKYGKGNSTTISKLEKHALFATFTYRKGQYSRRSKRSKRCLFKEIYDPANDLPIQSLTPGQQKNFNKQCRFYLGKGFSYFHKSGELDCVQLNCIGHSENTKGMVLIVKLMPGAPCAPGKMCVKKECRPLNLTSYGPSFRFNHARDGQWSPWSNFSDCLNPTPGMASFRVATRTCNNPRPRYGAFCAGLPVKGELCPHLMEPKTDVESADIGNEICTDRKENGPSLDNEHFNYKGYGRFLGIGETASCLVLCSRQDPRKVRDSTTKYLVPDGLSCSRTDTDRYADRVRGIQRYCLQGRCMVFGCDGRTREDGVVTELDVCGVCGGSNDTCVHGQFDKQWDIDIRRTVVILPVGAKDIYLSHPLATQRGMYLAGTPKNELSYFTEIWTKDNQPIVANIRSKNFNVARLGESPVSFAGTFWYFEKDVQSFTARGPLNQPVVIKIYDWSRSFFTEASYRYVPETSDADLNSTQCTNGSPLAGGCRCNRDYYGIRCEHQCELYCENGAALDTDECRCLCDVTRQTGHQCSCKDAFKGENCQDCVLTECQNGSVLNSTSCECYCGGIGCADGQWSPWSNFSDCLTPTPGRASFRIANRTCDNPKPLFGADCVGPPEKFELCPHLMEPNTDVEPERIESEVCNEHTNDTGNKVFLDTGKAGSCGVRCSRHDGTNTKDSYPVPDGLSCSRNKENREVDKVKGVQRYCLQGRCLVFGCDGRTLEDGSVTELDVCGVCGGSGNTCVHGHFDKAMEPGDRYTLVILPVGAKDIYVMHPISIQRGVSLEIWTKDMENNQPIVSRIKHNNLNIARMGQSPVNFAGTFWYFEKDVQSFTARGPLNQPVTIKIYDRSVSESTKAYYHYVPTISETLEIEGKHGVQLCPGTDLNTTQCTNGFPLAGGCNCNQGFYGVLCEHQCDLYCENGAILDTEACRCLCDVTRQTGRQCKCRETFKGENCQDCALTECQNEDVLNSTSCECQWRSRDGLWSAWSNFSDCLTPTLGRASFRVATRTCETPRPQFDSSCVGTPEKAELCPHLMEPNTDVEPALIDREICTNYTGRGKFLDAGEAGSCVVRCSRDDGTKTKDFYPVPDGLSCSRNKENREVDKVKGVQRYCLQGRCLVFGCDGRTLEDDAVTELDVCGICGGSGNTCVHGHFDKAMEPGDRHTLVILPVGAKDIYVIHPISIQRGVSLEIWTKDVENNQPIVSRIKHNNLNIARMGHSPVNFAGTFWYFEKDVQSFTARGPLNQPVVIKIYDRSVSESTKASYRYVPTISDADLNATQCTNGSPLAGGCSCREGFYGIRCEHQCDLYCENGVILDTEACRCLCDVTRQTGPQCKCREAFKGENCQDCALTGCQNGGVLNSTSCECHCPVNCGGIDCSKTCENTRRCDRNTFRGRCGTEEQFDDSCRLHCGFCEFDPDVNGGRCEPA